ncbi:MAG: response regulator [Pseudomonadota bacterium]
MGAKDKNDIRILVVDDDVEIADTVKEFLSNTGYSVTAVSGGREALTRFREGDFQLVITDLKMPEIDGIELLETIKKIDRKVSVVVITGYGTIESAVKAIKLGAYDFIQKPLRLRELRIVVERALEKYDLSKQLGVFKGLTLALLISIPLWLILGIVLALVWK